MIRAIELVRGIDGQRVSARIVDLNDEHLEEFGQRWRGMLQEYHQEDKYWDWAHKRRRGNINSSYEYYAVEAEEQTQGLMMVETRQHRSWLNRSQFLIYIESIATAPWNRLSIQRPPRFRGVGTALLLFARQRSIELGYMGRVGLHALPTSEQFYERQGMIRCELDPDEYLIDPDDEEILAYFEYPAMQR